MNVFQLVEGLTGRTDPVRSLFSEVSAAGARVERFPGRTSPFSGNGGQLATADFHYEEQVWKIYYPARFNAHQVYHELLHVRGRHLDSLTELIWQRLSQVFLRSNFRFVAPRFDGLFGVAEAALQ
ncbi:hypothetical protein P3T40_008990 [Paraburkholderia sp. EB58]|jgi:hypothetical protein|uniref:hypothetical protein n=1 Tax=Paraburkholderia sp. EB58 TaxID=3035125 RepID=UPI003D21EE0A